MALLTLTRMPTVRQRALFEQWLQPTDVLLLREDARSLLWQPNPTVTQGCIRSCDAKALGGQPHPDWKLITEAQWVELTVQHQPLINW